MKNAWYICTLYITILLHLLIFFLSIWQKLRKSKKRNPQLRKSDWACGRFSWLLIDKAGQSLVGQCHPWTDGLGVHTNEGWGSQEAQISKQSSSMALVTVPASKFLPFYLLISSTPSSFWSGSLSQQLRQLDNSYWNSFSLKKNHCPKAPAGWMATKKILFSRVKEPWR